MYRILIVTQSKKRSYHHLRMKNQKRKVKMVKVNRKKKNMTMMEMWFLKRSPTHHPWLRKTKAIVFPQTRTKWLRSSGTKQSYKTHQPYCALQTIEKLSVTLPVSTWKLRGKIIWSNSISMLHQRRFFKLTRTICYLVQKAERLSIGKLTMHLA